MQTNWCTPYASLVFSLFIIIGKQHQSLVLDDLYNTNKNRGEQHHLMTSTTSIVKHFLVQTRHAIHHTHLCTKSIELNMGEVTI